MELTEFKIGEIERLVQKGETSRKKILYSIIDDYDQLRVLALYIKRKDEIDIYKETNISLEKIREIIEYIDVANRIIDSKKHIKAIAKSKKNKEKKQNQNSCLRVQLERYKYYFETRRISKEKLEKDYPKIKKAVDKLNNIPSDIVFLSEVLMYLNRFDEAELNINEKLLEDLSESNRTYLENNKKIIIQSKNAKHIKQLCAQKKKTPEIIKIIENKLTGEERKIIDLPFVQKVVNEYYEERLRNLKKLSIIKENEERE